MYSFQAALLSFKKTDPLVEIDDRVSQMLRGYPITALHRHLILILRTVALMDSTKVGRDSLLTIFTAHEPEEIITDDGVTSEVIAEYTGAGVNLVVAQPNPVAVR